MVVGRLRASPVPIRQKMMIRTQKSSRFFDLLNSMIYDLKRSVEDDCFIGCYIHPQMILFFCRDEM